MGGVEWQLQAKHVLHHHSANFWEIEFCQNNFEIFRLYASPPNDVIDVLANEF